jgi:DNA polymerase elongation subunit (family B)
MGISKKDIEAIFAIYINDDFCKGNITRATKYYCKIHSIDYDDSARRKASKLLKKYIEKSDKLPKDSTEPITSNTPKILIFDIETAPNLAYCWSMFMNNTSLLNMQLSDWFILTHSSKWLFDKEVMSSKITPEEVANEDDRRIVQELWDLLDEAQIILGHNIKKFDIKKINARFLKHKMGLPSPYQVIDTLSLARNSFALSSNKLDYIATYLGLKGKMDTGGFELWRQVMKGDQAAIDKMSLYNNQDVIVNEEVYLRLREYSNNHPNIGLYIDDDITRCPSCGSSELKGEGYYYTSTTKYLSFRCSNCNSLSKSRTNCVSKDKSKSLLRK